MDNKAALAAAQNVRTSAVCPQCGALAFQVGSSDKSWRCSNCATQFDRPGADAGGYLPGVKND
jgi:transposase-like protein